MRRRIWARLALVAGCGACACDAPTAPPGGDLVAQRPLPAGLELRSVRIPPAVLSHDDGSAELGAPFTGGAWQFASVFRNPYPVPARVDEVALWIRGGSGAGAPFQFALFEVDANRRPTTEREISPAFGAMGPSIVGACIGSGMRSCRRTPTSPPACAN
jgi:hypothetical protein